MNKETPTPRIDAAKEGPQAAHDSGNLTYESMLFQMVGKLSTEGRTLERELTEAQGRIKVLEDALKLIVDDLPVKRDWLNPDVEKFARAALAKDQS